MKERKVYVDFDEEANYLNNKAKQGYALKKYSIFGVYHFEKREPQNLNYKIDYRIFKNDKDFNNYVALFEDAGWRHVSGTWYSANQYFLSVRDDASNDIFSDKESRALRYKTQTGACIVNFVLMLLYLFIVLLPHNFNVMNLAFLTPGLWELEGLEFWKAFLFELPFVVFRFIPLFLLAALAFIYGKLAIKSRKAFKKYMS